MYPTSNPYDRRNFAAPAYRPYVQESETERRNRERGEEILAGLGALIVLGGLAALLARALR